ncbi:hypothetical protein KIPB_010089, partial [Kipferlia bialata]|eukprot:g10089.t1
MAGAALLTLVLAVCLSVCVADDPDFSGIDPLMASYIDLGYFPGAVVLVGDATGTLFTKGYGAYTYGVEVPEGPLVEGGPNPPIMEETTMFDMASCTKVLMTTTAVAQLYQTGDIELDTPMVDERHLGPGYAGRGGTKVDITPRNLLLHNSGLPADPEPNFWEVGYDCMQTRQEQPALTYDCLVSIADTVYNMDIINPVGEVYLYS